MTAKDIRGLCAVLFGMPAAGKSSLLGALAQAAHVQPGLLGGRLEDHSGGLDVLRQRVYEGQTQETLDEIVPFPVNFQPEGRRSAFPATLIDCDGRIAYRFLSGERALTAKQGQGDLNYSLQKADAILLVVDVAAGSDQLKRDFTQFAQFLRWFEEHRSKGAEVAGLPVYLVLTKCDLLARPQDTSSQWLQRIEEGKRKISQRFKEFLAGEPDNKPFGRIDLFVWATAVRRPDLADKPARPTEPFGVAELFRQCFTSGEQFRGQRGKAEFRLQAAVAGIIGFLTLLVMAAALFFLSRPSSEVTALENAARAALPAEDATASQRLKPPLEDKIKALEKVSRDPQFKNMAPILQDRVLSAQAELKKYQELWQRFQAEDKGPEDFTREENLAASDKFLRELTIPEEYVELWKPTELGQRLEERRLQVSNFRLRVAETEGMLRKSIRDTRELVEDYAKIGDSKTKWEEWRERALKYLERHGEPSPDPKAPVPGFPEITYQRIYSYAVMENLLRDWEAAKKELRAKTKG
ncbi:MAG: GTPase domain-containing protein [Gemmataceae bacterium]